MPDSYLEIAEKAIRQTKRPLHPKEILQIAFEEGIVPEHLYGMTLHKTMAARLSTEIRNRADKSPFFRTGANRFFLKDLKTDKHPIHKARKRKKTLHSELVLTISDEFLRETGSVGLIRNIPKLIEKFYETEHLKYVVRKSAERRYDIKQIVSYPLIFRNHKLLTYRRGTFTNAAEELLGMRSIGFGGHVTDEDLNLFDTSGLGIIENARRELFEELVFDLQERAHAENALNFRFLCGINIYDTVEAKKHIAITAVYFCSNNFEPKKNEMSINDLRWTDLSQPENNLEDFEPWSRTILSALYSGDIEIEQISSK